MESDDKGIVLVYTGNGKGKTTASLGLALRASGHGKHVFMVQFIKSDPKYGEIKAIEKYLPNFTVVQTVNCKADSTYEENVAMASKTFQTGVEALMSGEYDLVIFDEINLAITYNFLSLDPVLEMLTKRPEGVDVLLSGRDARQEIIDMADLVSEVREVKHHYKAGVKARSGMEF